MIALFLKAIPATALEKDNKGKSPLDYAEDNETLSSLILNKTGKNLQ